MTEQKMTYANLTNDGAILGSFHATKGEAVADAKVFAKQRRETIRVVCYGRAGDVKSITEVGA